MSLLTLSEENKELIRKIANELGIDSYLKIEGIGKKKSQELIKVQKDSIVAEFKTNSADTVNVFIYERAFDLLDEKQKEILIKDSLNSIHYDLDKDKVIFNKRRINISEEGWARWGEELVNAAEAGILAMEQIDELEKEEKENSKKCKK